MVFDRQAALPDAEPATLRFHRVDASEREDAITHFTEQRQAVPDAVAVASWQAERVEALAAVAEAAPAGPLSALALTKTAPIGQPRPCRASTAWWHPNDAVKRRLSVGHCSRPDAHGLGSCAPFRARMYAPRSLGPSCVSNSSAPAPPSPARPPPRRSPLRSAAADSLRPRWPARVPVRPGAGRLRAAAPAAGPGQARPRAQNPPPASR
ncbi:hypothetical protein [Vulcaniibacterium tengchongense]|uniref:hypothetical protein n=1 Tax=Vulcaniibacterium tengchongense TaxID=1273429 RepID=UPI003CCE43DB